MCISIFKYLKIYIQTEINKKKNTINYVIVINSVRLLDIVNDRHLLKEIELK